MKHSICYISFIQVETTILLNDDQFYTGHSGVSSENVMINKPATAFLSD